MEVDWLAAYWASELPVSLFLERSFGAARPTDRTGLAVQIIGSPCFVFAGLVFAVETQTRWWKPNLTSVGWWV